MPTRAQRTRPHAHSEHARLTMMHRALGLVACSVAAAAAAAAAPRRGIQLLGNVTARPSRQQLDWHAREVGAMVTWNLQAACVPRAWGNASGQACQEGAPDGTPLYLPDAAAVRGWNPADFDAGALLAACTSFGARYVVFVADHMAGMALWPSLAPGALTVANTSYKGGAGDIVGEVAAAAAAAGVSLGFFYSTHYNYAQGVNNYAVGWPRTYGGPPLTQAQYEDFVLAQLGELAGYARAANGAGGGPPWELWFDGGFNATATPRVGPWVRAHAPDALCHSCFGATEAGAPGLDGRGLRWMGNEDGSMPLPSWGAAVAAAPPYNGDPTAPLYMPPSSDTVLRQHFWFWQPALAGGAYLRPPCEMLNVYLTTVGRASNLVLNVAPTASGAILPEDAAAYAALGDGVACLFSAPLGSGANLTLDDCDGAAVLALPAPVPARAGPCSSSHSSGGGSCGVWELTAAVGEDLATGGQRIAQWTLEGCVVTATAAAAVAETRADAAGCTGTWAPLLNASWPAAATIAVGHKRIVRAGAALPLPPGGAAGALALTAVRFTALSAYAWAGAAPPATNPPYVLTTLAVYDRAPDAVSGCLPAKGCQLVDY